jgi:hypothetical protein
MNETIYNGRQKIRPEQVNFLFKDNVRECIISIKIKNVERFYRILQRILGEGSEHVINLYIVLLNKICHQKYIPYKCQVSKIIPVFKKGDKSEIENCQPILNLCSSSKISEKLIVKKLAKSKYHKMWI